MGSSCMKILCCSANSCCGATMKINPKLFSRVGFIIINLIAIIFCLLVVFYGANLLKPFDKWIQCPSDQNFECLGISSIYRMSFALFTLHFLTLALSLCGEASNRAVNQNCWSMKAFFVFGLFFGLMFVPNSFFAYYAEAARYISVVFSLYKVLIIISFAHVINIKLAAYVDAANERGSNTACWFQFLLIFITAASLGVSCLWIVLAIMYHIKTVIDIVLISVTIALGVIFTALSISSFVNSKRLLTSIFLFSYITYITWSAMKNNTMDNRIIISELDILVGLGYVLTALYFVGFYVSKSPSIEPIDRTEEQQILNNNPIIESEGKLNLIVGPEDRENALMDGEPRQEPGLTKAYILFQLFMLFMTIYYSMLLTNWNVIGDHKGFLQSSVSYWIKFSIVVMTSLLYIWILIAPRLFPNRNFVF